MDWKDILVHVDETKACAARIDLAVTLARSHGAHLVGLYTRPPDYVPGYAIAEVGLIIRQAMEAAATEARDKAEALFSKHADKAGLSVEWRADEGIASDVVTLHARYVDLAIVGQTDPDEERSASSFDLPEQVVLDSGRPVLVVPYAGTFDDIGRHPMIAWNGSLEATRAVNDALPFLERAKRVIVMAVNPQVGPEGLGEVPGADLALHLARHGVTVEATDFVDKVPASDRVPDLGRKRRYEAIGHVSVSDMSIGDALLSRIADMNIDLLVMGAYGHSRLREFLMGGVTRHILRSMTVPVLMSH